MLNAAALDPQFSEAYGGIADSQLLLFDQNIDVSPEVITHIKNTLHHALLLKPDSADAFATLGTIKMSYDWDWSGAETDLRHATEAAPDSPNVWIRYGVLQLRLRHFEDAQRAIEKGVSLDPLSMIGNANLGMVYFFKKDFAAADAQFKMTSEISPRFGMAEWLLSWSLWQEGKKGEAVDKMIEALENDGNEALGERLLNAKKVGQPEDAVKLLLREWRNNPEKTNPHNLAYLSTYVGDREKAMYWPERSFAEHHPWTTWIFAAPEFDLLRGDPEFKKNAGQG